MIEIRIIKMTCICPDFKNFNMFLKMLIFTVLYDIFYTINIDDFLL